MSIPAWAQILGYVFGTGGLLGGGALAYKARPEAQKIKAEAAQVLNASAIAIVQGVEKELEALRAKVEKLEEREEERDRRDVEQDRRLRRHERWDMDMVRQLRDKGIDVPDPPPLYPDPTAA